MMNNEIYHYGVPGMKWGVRRSQNKLGRIDKRSKKNNWSDDATTAAKIKTKKVSQMTNAELRKLNDRKNLERNYSQLNPNAIKRGMAVAGVVAGTLGTVAAIYTNGGKVISIGKEIVSKIAKR